ADRDDRLECRAEGAVREELRQRDGGILPGDPDGRRDVAAAQGKSTGQQVGQAGQQSPGGILLFPLTENRDLAASSLQADTEGVLDGPEVFVGDSEERGESGFGQGYGVSRFRNRLCSLRR
ncbi:MAG: hypothetical protein ABW056_01700, partial [Thermoanaerobaculia bacterium]